MLLSGEDYSNHAWELSFLGEKEKNLLLQGTKGAVDSLALLPEVSLPVSREPLSSPGAAAHTFVSNVTNCQRAPDTERFS